MIYNLSRGALVFVWLWHGLVPKLIVHHPDEALPLTKAGFDSTTANTLVTIVGWGELLFGLVILILWKARWPLWLSIVAMGGLLIGMFFTAPELVVAAFNPVTLNALVIVVAFIALRSQPGKGADGADH